MWGEQPLVAAYLWVLEEPLVSPWYGHGRRAAGELGRNYPVLRVSSAEGERLIRSLTRRNSALFRHPSSTGPRTGTAP